MGGDFGLGGLLWLLGAMYLCAVVLTVLAWIWMPWGVALGASIVVGFPPSLMATAFWATGDRGGRR